MNRTLLTFTGFHDPYSRGLVGEQEQPGPILSLVSAQPFDRIVLFSTPTLTQVTAETRDELQRRVPTSDVQVRDVPLNDPTDYSSILKYLRVHIRELIDEDPEAAYFVAVASGTPQMHACWVLLVAGGEIPARILHVRPPRFVTKDRPLVTEVDLSAAEFPAVRATGPALPAVQEAVYDLGEAVRKLGIVGDHPRMVAALETAATLAPSDVPILITGETGTGKELLARLIHSLSGRRTDRFVAINCAAVPESLVESFLFGHKKGAFTGAIRDQPGKFDLADEGTLFLDELTELPATIQAKLLRVLQDGLVEPLGSGEPHRVDVRIVAATNRDVWRAIRERTFREDLYYRLNVGEIHLPPLRERPSDIPKLALHVLDRVNATLREPKRLSQSALARLQSHTWPGNIRDLENVIERSVRLCRAEVLDADELLISEPTAHADPLDALPEPFPGFSLEEFLSSARKQLILMALEKASGNQSEAARLLGVSPQAVSKFLRQAHAYNRG